MPGRRRDRLRGGDREPRRDTGPLVDRARLAQVAREPGQHLQQVPRHLGGQVRLLRDDADLGLKGQRVVRTDLGAEAVLQRGDDAPAVGVVLGVGAGDDDHVQRQPQRVAADLDVALLHDVQHRHLNALGKVGQLVDRHDAAVRPRDEAVRDGLGITEAAALGHLDGVDVADEVGHAGVRGGELLGVALAAVHPPDLKVVTARGSPPDRLGRDRRVGVLVQFGALDHRRPLVEQVRQRPQQPGLALTALTEQHDVVTCDERTLQLRDDGVLETQDSGPHVAALAQCRQQVLPDFFLDSALAMPGGPQLADGPRKLVW